MGVRDLGLERGKSRSGYRTIHDITVQRGRSPPGISNHPRFHGSAWKVTLWISNHPRFHGSAWKVTALDTEPSTISRFSVEGHALDIEPSTISRFSVESHRSGYRTIHDFTVQRGRSPLWKPSQSGRSEPTAELAQPALSSRRAYISAALTPDRPSTHRVTQHPPVQDMRLKSKCLFIARYGYACRITIS